VTIGNLSRVTVYDTFRDLDGNPEAGQTTVTALVDPYLTDAAIKSELLSTAYTVAWQADPATVDSQGSLRQSLVCGDDPDAAPTPWAYRVSHRSASGWQQKFTVIIPSDHPAMETDPDTGEQLLWLGCLAPLPQAPSVQVPYATQVLTTSGAPSTDTGRAGDYAIDDADPDAPVLYGPKTAGGWPAGVALVGPQGPPGLARLVWGGDAYPARPDGVPVVTWVGPDDPANSSGVTMVDGDDWMQTAG
jgi:hypothetical protein